MKIYSCYVALIDDGGITLRVLSNNQGNLGGPYTDISGRMPLNGQKSAITFTVIFIWYGKRIWSVRFIHEV